MSTVTIVTPSYNQGHFIEKTIKSVLEQNYLNLEYLIFDGGSSDSTVSILQKYQDKLYWQSEKDKGQSHAVNKGFQNATGEIIGWLNSDDIYYPDTIKKVCDFFENNPEADIVYGNAHHIDENDEIINLYNIEEWNVDRLKEICFICQPAVFFRRRIIQQYGLLDERLQYCMDYEYWLRLAMKGVKFHHTNQLLAGSRLHKNTKTLGSRLKVHFEINSMLRKKLGRVPNIWLRNYAQVSVEERHSRANNTWAEILTIIYTLFAEIFWNRRRSLSSDLIYVFLQKILKKLFHFKR